MKTLKATVMNHAFNSGSRIIITEHITHKLQQTVTIMEKDVLQNLHFGAMSK